MDVDETLDVLTNIVQQLALTMALTLSDRMRAGEDKNPMNPDPKRTRPLG